MPTVQRWARERPFIPSGSSPNTMDYLRFRGYKIPRDKTTGKPSTHEDGLEELRRVHPEDEFLIQILKARRKQSAQKYLDDSHVGRDERIHTTFTLDPSTGRLSCRNPNLMNVPVGKSVDPTEKELAEAIRSTIVAPEGYAFIERDWKGIEALHVGWLAKDETMIRWARLGIHGMVQAEAMGAPLNHLTDDSEILSKLSYNKKAHKTIYAGCKQTVHAFNYGETEYAIAMQLRKMWLDGLTEEDIREIARGKKQIPSKGQFISEARTYIAAYVRLSPGVLDWQDATREEAHAQGYLDSAFGYRLRFYDVFRLKPPKKRKPKIDRKGRILGEQANECLAFRPQNGTAGTLKEAILMFDAEPGPVECILPIHDSLMFLVRKEDLEEGLEYTREVMEAPMEALTGLVCQTEASVGERWSEMEELPLGR